MKGGVRGLATLVAYMLCNGAAGYAFFAFSPRLLNDFISEGEVSLVLLFQPLFIIISSPLAGRFSDRVGNRKAIAVTGALLRFFIYLWMWLLVTTATGNIVSFAIIFLVRGISIGLGTVEGAWFSDYTYKKDAPSSQHTGISFFFLITSTSWATGSLVVGWLIEIFSDYNLPLITTVILGAGIIPLAITRDDYKKARAMARESREGAPPLGGGARNPTRGRAGIARAPGAHAGRDGETLKGKVIESGGSRAGLIRDLRTLDQGVLVYLAVAFRHLGLITALSILAIVLEDIGLGTGVSGIILSLNPVFQILAMTIATFLVIRVKVRPLNLYLSGLVFTSVVLTLYTLGDALRNGWLVTAGQSLLGFAWSFLIIGLDEYIIRNVDWMKRARYIGYRQVFMNLGKVFGQGFFFLAYEFIGLQRFVIFSILIAFPVAASIMVAIARARHQRHLAGVPGSAASSQPSREGAIVSK